MAKGTKTKITASAKAVVEDAEIAPTVGSRPITVQCSPTEVIQGNGVLVVVGIDTPIGRDLTITLAYSPMGGLISPPASVVIPATFTSTSFTCDTSSTFVGTVTISAYASGYAGGGAVVIVADSSPKD
jgi:hypothetical protein